MSKFYPLTLLFISSLIAPAQASTVHPDKRHLYQPETVNFMKLNRHSSDNDFRYLFAPSRKNDVLTPSYPDYFLTDGRALNSASVPTQKNLGHTTTSKSIKVDSAHYYMCTGVKTHVKFSTTGSFSNASFKVELIDQFSNKIITVGTGPTSPISFKPADSLSGITYYVRVVTADDSVASPTTPDVMTTVRYIKHPVLSSNLLGTIPLQGICTSDLPDFRFRNNITGDQPVSLKRNGQTIYTTINMDFPPTEQQTGVYTALVETNGCSAESAPVELKISRPAEAKLMGSQFLDKDGSPAYLSLNLKGGGEYTVKINGISTELKLNNEYETITVNPKQNITYSLTSVSNDCGLGTVSGSAEITLCFNSLSLVSPVDNISSGNITRETNNTIGQITANNQISNNARVTYSAGKSITLTPGFSATNTGSFLAEIKGCQSTAGARDNEYKLGYLKLHINRPTVDRTIAEMTEFAAKGARMFQVTIRLEEVFRSLSQFNETNQEKLNEYWSLYDKVVRHAYNLYDIVLFRINVDYDDTRYYFQEKNEFEPGQVPYQTFENALFNLYGEIAQDQFNNPARVAYGSGHGSFSSVSATAKMKGFVQKVLDRYYPLLGEKLQWVSIVTTAQYETGFNYENSWDGVHFLSPNPCEYDYLPDNVAAFRNWLVTERYTSLAEVNTAHNTSYTSTDQIKPPKANVPSIEYLNPTTLGNMYNTVLFEDWYKFNYGQMKKFLLDCKAIIKSKSTDLKFCFEAGSCADKLTPARKTFDIPDINTYADILKTLFTNTTFGGRLTWEADLVRSNFTKEIQTEINEMDVVHWDNIVDPSVVKQKMIEYSKSAYLNGAKAIIFISDKSTPYYNNSLNALSEVKAWIESHTEQFTQSPTTINVKLSDLIRNFAGAMAPFNAISSSLPSNGYENRPKIVITKEAN